MTGTIAAPEAPSSQAVSRRAFLRTGTLVGAEVVVVVAPLADAIFAAPAGATGTFVSGDLDLHLLRRATYGLTPKTVSKIKSTGRTVWLEQQLASDAIDDPFVEAFIADRLPRLSWSYRLILAEVLEKRCRAGSVTDIFPGIPSDRLDVVGTRP